MRDTAHRAVAVVGLGAIMPDAPDVKRFWENLKSGTYSISEVDPERWDPDLYFSPDPATEDTTYSKIGGWVRDWEWKPFDWKLPIPPKVGSAMDDGQRWAIACTRSVLEDYGFPERPLDTDRTAVILGNAMAGEKHYFTALRVYFPEFARELQEANSFKELPDDVQAAILAQTRQGVREAIPDITEDSMPGELANVIAGRIANVFNLHGPNFVVDAACASAMAAISAAIEGLEEHDFDAVITGGIDRNMGVSSYVKFCKIGALSATGTRPYADGADGFVMGEGAALFLLKRLEDAERDGDHIYAVLRGMGGSSDGKGKGITAPNPVGQKIAIQRAWENAGLSPSTATYVEGHGTSTRVGDVVEVESLADVFASAGTEPASVALGSVKSNIGHLKGAAGAAGLLKTILALNEKVLPPSLHCDVKNPNIDFEQSPFYVNTELRDWEKPACGVRRAGVSAFGFGGTNFHAVLEEYVPGRLAADRKPTGSTGDALPGAVTGLAAKAPQSGAIVLGADTGAELATRLRRLKSAAEANRALGQDAPLASDLAAPERIAIDFKDPKDLIRKIDLAAKALDRDDASLWTALTSQGVFR
ncbi:MAG: polyketide synthase, partial [bacterium]|nr:polyketide synthase [bacterium]